MVKVSKDRRLAAEIGSLLARTRRLVFQRARRKLEGLGESIFVWRLLAVLHDEGPAILAELADATAQHPASISRLLDEMERQGLVKRTRDGTDRRRVQVELAPGGRARYLALHDQAVAVMEESLAGLSREEQELLSALLAKMIPER